MGYRRPFRIDPTWSFFEFLQRLFAYYQGGGVEGTGYRLNTIRAWLSMVGRRQALAALEELQQETGTSDDAEIAESLWMSRSSYRRLKLFVRDLPTEVEQEQEQEQEQERGHPIRAFVSYKWESAEHVAWVSGLATDLRAMGVETILDLWEVRYGESFTTYMQRHIAEADVILFVISPGAVAAAEARDGEGGPLQFEVQMMNARRMSEGVRIIGVYRSGDRPPEYLRDHRYVDFRSEQEYGAALRSLADDLLGRGGPPPVES